jgi:acetylornithine/succinyldiaminopimelate/putrescine aminotransferase
MAKHGSTLGGTPMACRLGCEFLSVMEDEDILARTRATGEQLRKRLEGIASEFKEILEIRGAGLMWGVEMSVPARPIAEEGLRRGVMFNVVQGNVLRFLSPLILSVAQVDQAMDVLEGVMNTLFTRKTIQAPAEERQVAHVA